MENWITVPIVKVFFTA